MMIAGYEYKVGDTVKNREDYNELPVGTVVRSAMFPDEIRVRVGDGWLHVMNDSGETELAGNEEFGGMVEGGTILVLGKEKPADPVQDLAERLWEVRNKTLDETGWAVYSGEAGKIHMDVYRALAREILGNYTKTVTENPKYVLDAEDDLWYRGTDDKYNIRWHEIDNESVFSGYSLQKLDNDHGPLRYLA